MPKGSGVSCKQLLPLIVCFLILFKTFTTFEPYIVKTSGNLKMVVINIPVKTVRDWYLNHLPMSLVHLKGSIYISIKTLRTLLLFFLETLDHLGCVCPPMLNNISKVKGQVFSKISVIMRFHLFCLRLYIKKTFHGYHRTSYDISKYGPSTSFLLSWFI